MGWTGPGCLKTLKVTAPNHSIMLAWTSKRKLISDVHEVIASFCMHAMHASRCRCMQVLRDVLPGLLARLRPDLVLYNAGVDVHAEDALGNLALSNGGIAQRDRFVLAACAAAGAPVACAIGGGYAEDHAAIVDRHVLLHEAAREALPHLAAVVEARRSRLSVRT